MKNEKLKVISNKELESRIIVLRLLFSKVPSDEPFSKLRSDDWKTLIETDNSILLKNINFHLRKQYNNMNTENIKKFATKTFKSLIKSNKLTENELIKKHLKNNLIFKNSKVFENDNTGIDFRIFIDYLYDFCLDNDIKIRWNQNKLSIYPDKYKYLDSSKSSLEGAEYSFLYLNKIEWFDNATNRKKEKITDIQFDNFGNFEFSSFDEILKNLLKIKNVEYSLKNYKSEYIKELKKLNKIKFKKSINDIINVDMEMF